MSSRVDIIATTISGSIRDWSKIDRIVPLFREHGFYDVNLMTVDSHADARRAAAELVASGRRLLIAAGGSGTFNSVLEGCYDVTNEPAGITLGFLRKGSADLIGKVLGMPDEIEDAIAVFANSIRENRTVPCDVLLGQGDLPGTPPRHFVGYGGAEIFGEVPRFTENRFMKYYKGILSQLFGDLGPFFVGTQLAIVARLSHAFFDGARRWKITVDGKAAAEGRFQAMIIVNGDLGPNLPFARSKPLGSREFYLFTIRDLGLFRLPGQLRKAWSGRVSESPEAWGFEAHVIREALALRSVSRDPFLVNFDGSAIGCLQSVTISLADQVSLLTR